MAMPWNKAEEEIEKINRRLEGTVSKADLDAGLTEGLKPLAELQGSIAAITETLKALTTPKEPPKVDPAADPEDDAVKMLTNPKQFLADGTKDIRDANLETKAELYENRARQDSKFAGVFKKFGPELVEAAKKYPVVARANGNFWQFLIGQFIGDKMIQGKLDADTYPSLIGSSSVGADDDDEGNRDGNFGFSSDMAQFFKSRGKDLGVMAKLRDRTLRDGDTIDLASWKGMKAVH
jgi:hypothetical protein